ncbi:hypothetical protein BS47DRAFT_1360426 [Hydnum rufescens UP504]|uniref:Uncharacterized protein n=1 Tax=Hydnum rufescens UP504 TaxID=1448309 RepID=A0A9P6B294_9AGAM|nr:hypothetical protein BS47DRAFT_1360426 [Hydnum rufescens UP504]
MPLQTWAALTSRKAFMDSYSNEFIRSHQLGKKVKDEFFCKFFRNYFEKYHWSLSNKDELSPDSTYIEPETQEGVNAKEKLIHDKKEVIRWWFLWQWGPNQARLVPIWGRFDTYGACKMWAQIWAQLGPSLGPTGPNHK